MDSKELGRCGERLAAGYLSSHGYSVLEMNYRCRFGELDIVARRDDMVSFAEVKTRRAGGIFAARGWRITASVLMCWKSCAHLPVR